MKLCRDCKYRAKTRILLIHHPEYDKCRKPELMFTDPVTGAEQSHHCSVARGYDSLCGQEAKHFEAK
jgi:hypothetical protein